VRHQSFLVGLVADKEIELDLRSNRLLVISLIGDIDP
jgi:hypothetical protein